MQVINPKAVAGAGGMAAGAGGGEVSLRSFRNLSIEGESIFDCIRLLSLVVPEQLYFAHNQAIIISGKMAAERGVGELFDFFERNPQIRRNNWVLVAKDELCNLLELPGAVIASPAQRIIGIMKDQNLNSYFPEVLLGDFMELLELEGSEAYAPAIQIEKKMVEEKYLSGAPKNPPGNKPVGEVIKIGGAAVFGGEKLACWFDEREARGLLWVKGRVRGGVIPVSCPSGSGKEHLSLEILKSKAKVKPVFGPGGLTLSVTVDVEAAIQEAELYEEIDNLRVINAIEDALAFEVQREIQKALEKARQYRADVFGFGTSVYRSQPRVWSEIKENWPGIFANLPVSIEVRAKVVPAPA